MDRDHIEMEINAMHQLLDGSDYKAVQMMEGLVSTMQDATAVNFISKFIGWLKSAVTDYGETIRQRAAWRSRLAELEEMLEGLPEEVDE